MRAKRRFSMSIPHLNINGWKVQDDYHVEASDIVVIVFMVYAKNDLKPFNLEGLNLGILCVVYKLKSFLIIIFMILDNDVS